MTPTERALALVDRLEVLVPRHPNEPDEAPIFTDLRSAIRDIGAAQSTEDCPACSGRGKVQRIAFTTGAPPVERDCSVCRGSGRLPASPPDPNWTPSDAAYLEGLAQGRRDATEWQPPDTAPKDGKPIKLLVESPPEWDQERKVLTCHWEKHGTNGWWDDGAKELLDSRWTVLAWKPADSTELPANFGEKT